MRPLNRLATVLLVMVVTSAAARAELLYVSSDFSHEVLRYDGDGHYVDTFISAASGGLNQPHGILDRTDDLLVASFGTSSVLRYNRVTGAFLGTFISNANGLANPVTIIAGPDDNLYVASQGSDQVQRYNPTTGAFIDNFATGGGLDGPSGMAFGPDGRLYVAGRYSANVVAYNGATGAFDEVIVDSTDGLAGGNTFGLAFAPNGDLFVASNNLIHRVNLTTDTVVATINVNAVGLETRPDGNLYAARGGANQIAQINPDTNATIDATYLVGSGGTTNFINFFHFSTVPPIVTGDANNDAVVDAADYLAVESNFGSLGNASGLLLGDANDDGRVDGTDLITIDRNFGAVFNFPGQPVPEPATAALLLLVPPCFRPHHRRAHSRH